MKKVILGFAILAATSLSAMAANDNNTTNKEKARTECSKQKSSDCKGKTVDCKGKKDGKCDRSEKCMKAFEGLNLTDAQKAKIEELQKECKAKRDANMKKGGENKDKKENLTPEQKQQRKAEMMARRKQEKQDFLNNVKSILTPEQYTKFLENNFKMAGNHEKGMRKGGKNMKGQKVMQAQKGKKGQRDDQKGQRNRQNGNGQQGKAQNTVSA